MIRRLLHKGWSDEEIIDFHRRHTPKKEHRLLVVLGFALTLLTAATIPYVYGVFAMILPSTLFYVVLAVLGLAFGSVIGILFVDLERLDHKHHVVLLFVIPIVLFASAHWFMSFGFATAESTFVHNALIGGLVYACAFTMTYAVVVSREWNLRIG